MSGKKVKKPAVTILVVDDEPGILQGISRFLEMEGFRVLQATNGLRALDQLSQTRCDLVITDLMMPYMDGERLIRRIRSNPAWSDMPVVLTSTALPPDSSAHQLSDVFLCRPFEVKRLIGVVNLLLERRHLS